MSRPAPSTRRHQRSRLRRLACVVGGWSALLLGVAALVLPGPATPFLVGGMALLAQEYDWAHRRLAAVEERARRAARRTVASRTGLLASSAMILGTAGAAAIWFVHPAAPDWWSLDRSWWLPGRWTTGAGMTLSAVVMAATLVLSLRMARSAAQPVPLETISRAAPRAGRS